MQLEAIAVGQLQPAPYNPRLTLKPGNAAWKKLERSLDEFELVQPIVWNRRTGHVVSGHQRLAILKHRGETEIDCVIVNLSLEKEKALNVTLNNQSVGSDWDPGKLIDLVEELQELPDFDVTLTGFDEQQLKDLVLAPEATPEQFTVDQPGQGQGHTVSLEVPDSNWSEVSYLIDQLLADYPAVRAHYNSPAS